MMLSAISKDRRFNGITNRVFSTQNAPKQCKKRKKKSVIFILSLYTHTFIILNLYTDIGYTECVCIINLYEKFKTG